MKLRSIIILFLIVLGPVSLFPANPNLKLPKEISEYYADYNFVNLFSSPGERYALIFQRDKIIMEDALKDKRLRRVLETLNRLKEHKIQVDPDISINRLKPKRSIMPNSIVDIVNVKGNDHNLSVLVIRHRINLKDQLKFIKDYYDIYEKKPPDTLPIESTFTGNEIHSWVKIRDVWKTRGLTISLL